jgi:DNA processing protein
MAANDTTQDDRLLALNAITTIDRSTICRLAGALSRWAGSRSRPQGLSRELGVPTTALARARLQLEQARAVADRERQLAQAIGARIITLSDEDYPGALQDLPLPPPVLYCRGTLAAEPAVAIVGSRRATSYGLEAARFFASHLTRSGAVIVSGLAMGVDAAAHQACVDEEGGRTIAVLGCGIDVCYPRHHRRLVDRISATGAVVSEFPFGTRPHARNFPVRNRVIAALARCTVVVEAAPRSGSLITARLALELGRDVFAVPGRIFDERSLGPNALIRDGALLALHPADLVTAIGLDSALSREIDAAEVPPPLAPFAAKLWAAMTPGNTVAPEALAELVEAPFPQVVACLLELELAGWVERFPGPVYARRGAWR